INESEGKYQLCLVKDSDGHLDRFSVTLNEESLSCEIEGKWINFQNLTELLTSEQLGPRYHPLYKKPYTAMDSYEKSLYRELLPELHSQNRLVTKLPRNTNPLLHRSLYLDLTGGLYGQYHRKGILNIDKQVSKQLIGSGSFKTVWD